jgi:hypothetical protein
VLGHAAIRVGDLDLADAEDVLQVALIARFRVA